MPPDGAPHSGAPLDNNYDDGIDDSRYRATSMGAMNGGPNELAMTRFTNISGSPVDVTPGEKYWLCMMWAPEAWPDVQDKVLSWYGSTSDSYSGGRALGAGPFGDPPFQESVTSTTDLGFIVYSKEADPVQTPTTPTTPATTGTTPATTSATSLPTGVTAGSGAAPATPTSSIKAPTELVATDLVQDQGGAIKLDWKASTTADIDGYKIFRSTEEKKNFAEIAKTTDKTIITYTDSTAAIGTTYYYMVRAYKGTKESASSNTVNAASVDNTAPAAPKNFSYEKDSDKITFSWDKNTETDLAGYTLYITGKASGTVIKNIDIEKDLTEYELIFADHLEVSADAVYEYSLIAKDTSNNLSDKAVATEKNNPEISPATVDTESKKGNDNLIWYIIGGSILILAGGFSLWWFKFRKKKTIVPTF